MNTRAYVSISIVGMAYCLFCTGILINNSMSMTFFIVFPNLSQFIFKRTQIL